MYKYTFNEDRNVAYVEVNDKRYCLNRDLRFVGSIPHGTQRPYLRRHTKVAIYQDFLETYPDEFNKMIATRSWYQAYKDDVEKKPNHTVKEVTDYIKETKEQPTMDKELLGVMTELTESVKELRKQPTQFEQAMLEGIIEKGKELAVGELQEEIKNNLSQFIEETYGTLPDRLTIVTKDIEYDTTGLFHNMFPNVLKLVNMNIPVMLTGGAGSGKNFMLEQVSEALNMSFYYTSTITQEYKLTGFIDGGGTFHETEFYKAFTGGGIFMLDEIDASIPECLVILNGAIANGYFDFPTGREIAHEDFRVVCAGNTVGLGADMVYTGRNVLDGATLDRFVLVEIDYDERIEHNLCQDEELRTFLYEIRRSVKRNKINHIVGMRTFKYSYELLMNGFDKSFIIKSVILKGLQEDDINIIKSSLRSSSWYSEIGA